MKLNKIYKFLTWLAVILWMSLIFYLSHQPATTSSELSGGITEVIITTLEKVAPNLEYNRSNFDHFVRKNAHFFIYLVLGIIVINALRRSGVSGFRGIALAFITCILYAISDEVHQIFIPGRSGELRDVLIDSAGSSVGIGLYMVTGRFFDMIKTR